MRFRNFAKEEDSGLVITHSTVDSGEDGEPQTAITFRSHGYNTDILSVTRPFPKSTDASYDSANTATW